MAVYNFSALADGQAITFDASADDLVFDQTAISASQLAFIQEGTSTRVAVLTGANAGKDVLLSGVSLLQLAQANVQFANGSAIRFGDNSVATNDDNANVLAGTGFADLVYGFGGNDSIQGNAGADVIVGGAGNDRISGNNDNDTIEGNAGNDSLGGGGGQDTFVFREAGAANADALTDFSYNWDRLQVDATSFTQAGAAGRLAAGDDRFHAAAGATGGADAEDRFVYNTTTRQLFYDADGNGAGAAQHIATLQSGASLSATDLTVLAADTPPGGGTAGTAGDDSIEGTAGDDAINGLAGNDTLVGNEGFDTLNGGADDDLLDGWDASFGSVDDEVDVLDGGTGDDVFRVDNQDDAVADAGGVDTVVARNIDWTLAAGFENLVINNGQIETAVRGIGNALDNVLDGRSTQVLETGGDGWHVDLDGLGGNDTLLGSVQEDTLVGGDGNDRLSGDGDVDDLTGGAGADRFHFAFGAEDFIRDFSTSVDTVILDGEAFAATGPSGRFSAGDERFFAGAAAHDASDRVIWDGTSLWYDQDGTGSAPAFRVALLQAGAILVATDILIENGTAAGQTLNGTAGNDSLVGAAEDDTITGNAGNDTLIGNAGNDSLDGGSGTDRLDGGTGDDIYIVTAGDVLVDSGGTDIVHTAANWTLANGFENAIMTGTGAVQIQGNNAANHITGNGANNYLNARAGNDTLIGGAGNDTFDMSTGGTSSPGQDVIDGGAGTDTVDYAGYARSGVTANLATGVVTGGGDGGAGGAALTSIERFIGAGFSDSIAGAAAAEYLDGRQGNDTIAGAAGVDTLLGGTGNDFFVFGETGAANADRINDFASGADELGLDNAVMAALGDEGAFGAGDARFWAAAGANAGHDASDRVVYNTSTGQLWYDADGSGSGGAQLVATLQAGAALGAGDITVI